MNKEKIGLVIQIVGVVLGVIGVLSLISQHPLIIGLEVLAAGLWFLGKHFKTQG
jgi:hypothetical protein